MRIRIEEKKRVKDRNEDRDRIKLIRVFPLSFSVILCLYPYSLPLSVPGRKIFIYPPRYSCIMCLALHATGEMPKPMHYLAG